jgi:hypothetical protein
MTLLTEPDQALSRHVSLDRPEFAAGQSRCLSGHPLFEAAVRDRI